MQAKGNAKCIGNPGLHPVQTPFFYVIRDVFADGFLCAAFDNISSSAETVNTNTTEQKMKKFLLATLLTVVVASLSSCGALWRALTETEGNPELMGTVWMAKVGSQTITLTMVTSVRLDWKSSSGMIDAMTKKPDAPTVTSMNYSYTAPNIVITDPNGVYNTMEGVVDGEKMTFGGLEFIKQQE
jgi:hypothetical protein